MVTAKDKSDNVVTALELFANDYVTKPLDFPVVLARVHTRLCVEARWKRSECSIGGSWSATERSSGQHPDVARFEIRRENSGRPSASRNPASPQRVVRVGVPPLRLAGRRRLERCAA